jgi:hypothetical protein
MMAGNGHIADTEARAPVRASVSDLFTRLIGDARVWVNAEIAVLKCRGTTLVGALKTAVIFLVAAALLALVALIALAIGAIMALATLVGPGWATLIVVAVLLVIAGVLGWLGAGRIKRAFEDQS